MLLRLNIFTSLMIASAVILVFMNSLVERYGRRVQRVLRLEIREPFVYESFQLERQTDSKKSTIPKNKVFSTPNFSKLKTFLLFIGYPRSGSTLTGSLLDAHPSVIIANEYNLFIKWKNFTDKQKNKHYICNQLWNNSVAETRHQRAVSKKYFFQYYVPGLWQGLYQDPIQIYNLGELKKQTRIYLNLVDMNVKLRKQYTGQILDVYYGNIIMDAKKSLLRICEFLEIICDNEYLEKASSIVFKNETFTRRFVYWDEHIKRKILDKIENVTFLNGFKFNVS
ncbi:uncharacterized protein LOC100215248 isoform X2 [Hydra vulgaris]|uniref:uncharacterized protein LOC100215248 isoform X2 n=1 Tax=Hydra vulgaris TaxID=6087 RepID=UPI001F5F4C5D|nr:uncharacterized protein LOC100215248 isoform X2 [Hydra vulgaris]